MHAPPKLHLSPFASVYKLQGSYIPNCCAAFFYCRKSLCNRTDLSTSSSVAYSRLQKHSFFRLAKLKASAEVCGIRRPGSYRFPSPPRHWQLISRSQERIWLSSPGSPGCTCCCCLACLFLPDMHIVAYYPLIHFRTSPPPSIREQIQFKCPL